MLKMVPYNKGRQGKARKSSVGKISAHELPFSVSFYTQSRRALFIGIHIRIISTKNHIGFLSGMASRPQITIL
jgi:hypothetical protein